MEEDLRGERACPPACLRAGRVPPWPSGMPDITSLPGGGGERGEVGHQLTGHAIHVTQWLPLIPG